MLETTLLSIISDAAVVTFLILVHLRLRKLEKLPSNKDFLKKKKKTKK